MDDTDAIRLWHDEDPRRSRGAKEWIWGRCAPRLFRFFANKTCGDDPADLVLDTLEAVREYTRGNQVRTTLDQIVFTIAQHKWADYLRRKYRQAHQRVDIDFAQLRLVDIQAGTPSSIVVRRRQLQSLIVALRECSLEDQILLEMRYFEGLTEAQMSELFGEPASTIHGRFRRAVTRLRDAVACHLTSRDGEPAIEVTADALDTWAAEIRSYYRWTGDADDAPEETHDAPSPAG